jgi:glycosyltransferase involved in cell wall biosynthesis
VSSAPKGAADRPRTLVLFLSNGGSLARWKAEGILSREILLYQQFIRAGVFQRVLVFSYDPADHALLAELRKADDAYVGIEVLTPPKAFGRLSGLPAAYYGFVGVALHAPAIRGADWLKTNQISGAWAAIFARLTLGPKLLIRLGYVLSRRFAMNGQGGKAAVARFVEGVAFRASDQVVVTSEEAAKLLRADTAIAHKVALSPTYVDVNLFRAKDKYAFDEPVIWIGRFEAQKNILNLVKACQAIGRPLHLVGSGSLEGEIRALAAQGSTEIRLLGRVPNEELAALLRSYSVFALPSLHEGLPKVLIEAMAVGLVCVGSAIPGIVDLIEDGVSGYLIEGFEVEAIAGRLAAAFAERDAARGRAARTVIENTFSLERYVVREAALYAASTASQASETMPPQ